MVFTDRSIPEDTRRTVNAALSHGRLSQSILLSGGSAALRETCAKELAMAALCASPLPGTQTPCGECHCCRKVLSGTHPDLTRVVPSEGRKTVAVSDVQRLVMDPLYQSPTEAENKVYLFPGADTLSPQIQNKLLKSIEEPPEDAMFLFLCETRESLLPTVISRLTEYPLGDVFSAAGREKDENVTEIARGLAAALAKEDEFGLMLKTAPMAKNRTLMAQVAAKLTEIVRDALIEHSGAAMLSGCDREAMFLSVSYAPASLIRIKDAMDRIAANAAANANENLLITLFSSSLAAVIRERK